MTSARFRQRIAKISDIVGGLQVKALASANSTNEDGIQFATAVL
jgi:hypothetical protein